MKSYLLPTVTLALLVSPVSAQDNLDLTNPKQKTSYVFGMDIVSTL
jgi:hypothetical protein